MSEHNALRSLLADFVSGLLSEEDGKRVRHHLDMCAACSRDAAVLQRLAQAVRDLPAPALDPEYLARLAALAAGRRIEVIGRRRQTLLVTAAALLGWALVIISIPLWRWFAQAFLTWSGLPVTAGDATTLALGALLTYLFLPGLWALLDGRCAVMQKGEQR